MRVYVLEKGEYSYADVVGVFSTLELAQGALPVQGWEEGDPNGLPALLSGVPIWFAREAADFDDLLTIREFEVDQDRKLTAMRAEAAGY